jgi:hypothetical protein
MDSLMISQRLYRVECYTPTLRIEGKLEPMGDFVNAFNDPRRGYLPIHEATVTALSAGNPLGSISVPTFTLNKKEAVMVAVMDKADYEGIRLLSNTAWMTVYTETYAIRAEFHMGGEMRERDLLDAVTNDFVPVTKARLFPLLPSRVASPPTWEFAVLNRVHVIGYHGEKKG